MHGSYTHLILILNCTITLTIDLEGHGHICPLENLQPLFTILNDIRGVFWRPIDQDQVLTTWSGGRQNGLVLNLWLCDVTALQASKSDINTQ